MDTGFDYSDNCMLKSLYRQVLDGKLNPIKHYHIAFLWKQGTQQPIFSGLFELQVSDRGRVEKCVVATSNALYKLYWKLVIFVKKDQWKKMSKRKKYVHLFSRWYKLIFGQYTYKLCSSLFLISPASLVCCCQLLSLLTPRVSHLWCLQQLPLQSRHLRF